MIWLDIMDMRIVKAPIPAVELQEMARVQFGDIIKAVVDVKQEIMAVGPEMHADGEVLLMDAEGSLREHTWGINIYPDKSGDEFVEFDSMINLKPAFGNRSRGIENEEVRKNIRSIVAKLIKF